VGELHGLGVSDLKDDAKQKRVDQASYMNEATEPVAPRVLWSKPLACVNEATEPVAPRVLWSKPLA